jgi:hypothetical protein
MVVFDKLSKIAKLAKMGKLSKLKIYYKELYLVVYTTTTTINSTN